jgi:DNA-binding HxlR family transcriptional regulator
MEILAKLFDSKERVQIMRFFLFNQDFIYSVSDLFLKTGASKKDIDRELDNLEKAGLIRRKPFIKGQKDLEGGILKGRHGDGKRTCIWH